VQALRREGIDAIALPLIEIAAAPDTAAVEAAWQTVQRQRLVVFVSPNAAQQFFAQRPAGLAWPDGVLAASVGPGTTQILQALGVPAASIVEPAADAAQFDSESLWQQLKGRSWQAASVLVVRGDGGRDWLADTLRSHGADVAFVAAYRRVAPRFDGATGELLDAAIADPLGQLWFFSSSEAVGHLVQARPRADWSRARAIATHPRIAERARDCGFGVVRETRPGIEDVVACIQSFAS
jgi:uroporphyrinogen-III synthase